MSKFTDYDRTSQHYDVGRRPAAVNLILAMMQYHTGRSLADLHVLDAGCGTGNYTCAVLEAGVGRITMIDANSGMLDKARAKLRDAVNKDRVDVIRQVVLPDMPFDDNSFDVVMYNLVLHHLDDSEGFPKMAACIQQAQRVLKPDGLLVMCTCTPEQVHLGKWYAKLTTSITHRYAAKFADTKSVKSMLQRAKFRKPEMYNVLGSDWFIHYNDTDGLRKPSWRDNDSYWSTATDQEIKETITIVNNMRLAGTLQKFKEENDGADVVGHFTVFLSTVQK